MLLMLAGVDAELPPMAQLVLAGVVQFVFGARFYVGAYRALRAGSGSMDTLVALGTTAAFGLSVAQLGTGGALYFEASAAVIALVRVGKWLEGRARRQAGEAIRALGRLRPDRARIRRGGAETEIAAAALRLGDLLVIRPGERIAADAVVREGQGTADESLLTGEELARSQAPRRPGDRRQPERRGAAGRRSDCARGREPVGPHGPASGGRPGQQAAGTAYGGPSQRRVRAGGSGRPRCSPSLAGGWRAQAWRSPS